MDRGKMASQWINLVIVKNLPQRWTLDHLQNFLEVVTSVTVADDGIQVFRGITHTALVRLEEAVTEKSLVEDQHNLGQTPFEGKTLQLEGVQTSTRSLLVSFSQQQLTHSHVLYYFNDPKRSGCGEAEVVICEMHADVSLAVVHFSLPEGVTKVIAKGNHLLQEGGEFLGIEPWYELFHRPLLEELRSGAHQKEKPPVAPKPKARTTPVRCAPPPPHQMPPQKPKAQTTPVRCAPPPPHQVSPQHLKPLATPAPCAPPQQVSPQQSEIEHLRGQMERLKEENMELKTSKAEKQQKKHSETQSENERLKSENEKLKKAKQTSIRLPVPAHKLHLLADFTSEGCQVMLMEQEEVALFHGIQEDCEEAQQNFLLSVQQLAEDAVLLSEPIFLILETARGKGYVEDMVQRYPGCAAKVQDSQLVCAAFTAELLQSFIKEFERNMMCKTCKVPPSLTSSSGFEGLKLQLEKDYMVKLTLPTGHSQDGEDLQLHGIKGDAELAAREVEQFTQLNRADSKQFHIAGRLQGQACKKWFYTDLGHAKHLIVRNGEIKSEQDDDGYTLTFQCRQEILPSVLDKLKAIKDGIISVRVDLNKEFPKYSERALVINGLHNFGVRAFCSHLAEKLKEEDIDSIGDFRLPDVCSLPQFSVKTGKRELSLSGRGWGRRVRHHRLGSGARSGRQPSYRQPSKHARSYPSLPCTVTVQGTTITFKSGDITEEQVGAAVCIVGQDLALKGTAIGSAFLKKCSSLAQLLQANGNAGGMLGKCHLVTTATAGGNLPMPLIFHAVLNKLKCPAVKKVVKDLVEESLLLTVQSGQTSLALPPFGVGRRFGFGEYTTASAMAFALKEFLQANPGSLEAISIVVYDARLAGKFAQIITKKLGVSVPPAPAAAAAAAAASIPTPSPPSPPPLMEEEDNSSDTGGDDDDDDDDDDIRLEEQEVPDLSDSHKEAFEAQICTCKKEDCKQVIDILLTELKTTFLWHKTVEKKDLDTLKLDQMVLQEILHTACRTNVYLSPSDRGLRLCGQKGDVHKLEADIRAKLLLLVEQRSLEGSAMRSKLGLPVNTDHLPHYWKICKKDQKVSYARAMEAWARRGVKLNSIPQKEFREVERLVQATWEATKSGAGKDARNLSHTGMELLEVKRLENPRLWREYSSKREQLFSHLEYRRSGTPPVTFTSVGQLKGSQGPLQTTNNIPPDSVLNQDIYHQVNEHYLFHGTKDVTLQKIYSQGLDFRLASDKTMLGPGVYAAESSTKADQYTDPKQNRSSGEKLTMILMRMLLGEPFVNKNPNPTKYKRPPCMSCQQSHDLCQCRSPTLFNSIIDDASRIFREFVVYDQNVCYPEYFITYRRV